ncbi:MAG: PEP/pyruvate-binding domain-containing protein, partial [Thermoplasmata archaeon]
MAHVVSLAEVSESDLPLVGGKASKLGELVREGLPVPPGFILTTEAYDAFVEQTALKTEIPAALASIVAERADTIEAASVRIRRAFESVPFPPALQKELETAYETFVRQFAVRFCAVRSSATAEDLEGASFAGLQDTYLNVTGTDQVVASVRKCWGSLFTPRVLIYRHRKVFDQSAVRLAVLIQKMVDATVSGILFTRDP